MNSVEILKDAYERISDPERWTQYALARDASYKILSGIDQKELKNAVRWCAYGTLVATEDKCHANKDYDLGEHIKADGALVYAANDLYGVSVQDVNDELGYGSTLRMFERAIEIEEQARREGR